MRYLKAALVGVASGVLLAAVVLGFEVVHAERAMVTNCADYQCFGAAQVGSVWSLLRAFALGFIAMFAWSLRRQREVGTP